MQYIYHFYIFGPILTWYSVINWGWGGDKNILLGGKNEKNVVISCGSLSLLPGVARHYCLGRLAIIVWGGSPLLPGWFVIIAWVVCPCCLGGLSLRPSMDFCLEWLAAFLPGAAHYLLPAAFLAGFHLVVCYENLAP